MNNLSPESLLPTLTVSIQMQTREGAVGGKTQY